MQIRFRLGPFFLLSSCVIQSLMAQPEGFQVVSGKASPPTVDQNGILTIQSENRAILSWDRFSIDLNEHVQFVQSGSNPAVLNRVLGDEASAILGRLSSNEGVYLLNPNGILIGPGALIETSGFVASTFDVLDQDFLDGKNLSFEGRSEQAIVNEGRIYSTKGDISLIASRVENIGQLQTDQGSIHMTSSGTLLFKPQGTSHLYVRLSQDAPATICHSGRIEARGGEVYLVADSGKTEVSGQIHAQATERQGGTVHILGDELAILSGAEVDVSAPEGNGTILVGGDQQGKNQNVKNATITSVEKEVLLKADATENGNGGKVIVWSDEKTSYSGFTSARGGEMGGNGGFVEVSGKHLQFQGSADRRAPMGQAGVLLLDPYNVTISTNATANENFAANTYTPTNTGANINTTDLVNNLGLGNVTVVTTGAGGEDGDIAIDDPIVWTTNGSLTLTADGSILVNADVQNNSPGTGNITMTALGTPGTGISINGAYTVSSFDGDVTLDGTSSTIGSPGVYLSGACIVRATGAGSTVSITGTSTAAAGNANSGLVIDTSSLVSTGVSGGAAGGAITLLGTASTNSTSTDSVGVYLDNGATVSVLGGGAGSITVTGTGGAGADTESAGILIEDGATIQTTDSSGTGNIHLIGSSAAGNVTALGISCMSTAGIASGGAVDLDNGIGGGRINFTSAPITTNSGNITIVGAGVILVANTVSSTSGNISITSTAELGSSSDGISCISATITTGSTSASAVTMTGTTPEDGRQGISITAGSMSVTGAGGGISLTGLNTCVAPLGDGGNEGCRFTNNAISTGVVSSVAGGNITIQGTGTQLSSALGSPGVSFSNCNISVFGGGTGSIAITGVGSANVDDDSSPGILFQGNAATVTTTGTGSISFVGSPGAGSSAVGIFSSNTSPTPVVSGGNVNLNNGSGTGTIVLTANQPTWTAAGNFTVGANAPSITLGGTGTTNQGPMISTGGATRSLTFNCPVILSANTTFSSNATATPINFNSTINGVQTLTLNTGNADITFGANIGDPTAIGAMTLTAFRLLFNGSIINAASINASGVGVGSEFSTSCTLTTTAAGGINFGIRPLATTVGGVNLVFSAGTGPITLGGGAGDGTPFASITATTSNNTVGSGFGIGSIFQAGSLDASAVTGRVTVVSTGASITTTGAGGINIGALIEGTTSGVQTLTLSSGLAGSILISSSIGASVPLNSFSSSGSAIELGGNITATDSVSINSSSVVLNQDAVITASGSNSIISFGGTSVINGARNLSLASNATNGTISVRTIGNLTPLTSFQTTSGGNATFNGNITTTGAITINSPALLATNTPTYTGSNISFGNTLNSSVVVRSLNLNATGAVTFSGNVGSTLRLDALSVIAATGVAFGASASSVTANSFSIAAGIPTTMAAATTLVNTSTVGGIISFGGTINGASGLTLTAGSGAITLTGVIGGVTPLTSLAATSTTSTTLSNNITTSGASGVVITGPALLAANPITIATGIGAISFSSTINGARALTLTATSGAISLAGIVGGTTPPLSLAATSTTSTTIANNITTSTATGVVMAGPVVLTSNPITINTVTGNGAINFSSATTSINGAQALTLSAGSGAITLAGAIGGTTPLTSLSATSTTSTTIANNITTSGPSGVVMTGPVLLASNPSTISTSNGVINFSSATTTINGAQNLTLLSGNGNITFTAAIGGVTPPTSLVATSTGSISIGGNISTVNSIGLNGASTIGQNTTLLTSANGGIIELTGSFNGAHVVVITGGAATGIATLEATMGGVTPLTSLSVSASSIELGANITTNGNTIAMNNGVTLTGNASLSTGATGSIAFSSTINGGFAFSANTATMDFGSSVGSISPLASIAVNANTIATHGNHSVSAGPMTYGGPVTLNQSTTFSNAGSSAVTFQDSTLLNATGGISGNFPLTISALPTGSILVAGTIDTTGVGANGAPVTLSANGSIQVQDVTTTGATNFNGGNVQMTSTSSFISVGTINVNGAGTGAGASILLQPSSGFTSGALGNIPLGIVVLNGDLLAIGNGSGSIVISANRSTAMSTATITSSLSGNNVTIDTPTFGVGANEAITILGDLTFTNNGITVVGDVVALGDLTFDASSSVTLLTHGTISILTFTGNLSTSPTAHFLTGGVLTNPASITPAGPLNSGHVNGLSNAILTYAPQSLILNYDSMSTPITPPTPGALVIDVTRESLINSFVIANSELFYLLDELPSNHRSIKICTQLSNEQPHCLAPFPWFNSWLPSNDVW